METAVVVDMILLPCDKAGDPRRIFRVYTVAGGESPTMSNGRAAARTTHQFVACRECPHEDHSPRLHSTPGSATALQADSGQTDLPTAHCGPAHRRWQVAGRGR